MASDWINKCGIPFRFLDDHSVEVDGVGVPRWEPNSPMYSQIGKIWQRWQSGILAASKKHEVPVPWLVGIINIESGGNPAAVAACEPTYCPALWNKGLCAAQGGPEKYCAGGLMAFISATAAKYGRTIEYYIQNPEDQIVDAASMIFDSLKRNGGDMLAVAKQYNGGATCAGGGIVGMGGQGDYVTKFIYSVNTFNSMGLYQERSAIPTSTGLLLFAAFGALAWSTYQWADREYGISRKVAKRI